MNTQVKAVLQHVGYTPDIDLQGLANELAKLNDSMKSTQYRVLLDDLEDIVLSAIELEKKRIF